MVEANELRIGNWVKPTLTRYGEKYIKIEAIVMDGVNFEFRPYAIHEITPSH